MGLGHCPQAACSGSLLGHLLRDRDKDSSWKRSADKQQCQVATPVTAVGASEASGSGLPATEALEETGQASGSGDWAPLSFCSALVA